MDDKNLDSTSTQSEHVTSPDVGNSVVREQVKPKTRLNMLAVGLLGVVFVLIVSISVLTWKYQQKVAEVDQKNDQIAKVEAEVGKKSSIVAEETPKVGSEEAVQPAEKAEPPKAYYEAEVGKFSLTLSDDYTIIRELDGNFEGGPATWLKIAKAVDSKNNVYEMNAGRAISINAVPKSNWEGYDLRKYIDQQDTDAFSKEKVADTQIDGQTAESYVVAGLFSKFCAYTENDGIFFQICGPVDDESSPSEDLSAVLGGIKFL